MTGSPSCAASAPDRRRAGRGRGLLDEHGRPILLGERLGEGGEGTVFAVHGSSELACKVHHRPANGQRASKLRAMVQAGTERLAHVAAWPRGLALRNGRVEGVLLPRVLARHDIHVLYGPRTRAAEFPDATYPFLVQVAESVARAFAVVHAHGHVIGDVNPGGVSVTTAGHVVLLDCDGFQIDADGQMFPCDVGVLEYQPPELQGVPSFRGLRRSVEHDRFGLAVLVFQLLFLGRHPFAGVPARGEEPLPLAQAIARGRFAWRRGQDAGGTRIPPGALGCGAVTPAVQCLFEHAFLGVPESRPPAEDWVAALAAMRAELVGCDASRAHAHPPGCSPCPLCVVEDAAELRLFPGHGGGTSDPWDVLERWRSLETLCRRLRMPDPAVLVEGTTLVRVPPRTESLLWIWGVLRRTRGQVALTALLVALAWYAGAVVALLVLSVIAAGELVLRRLVIGSWRDPRIRLAGLGVAFVQTREALESARWRAPFEELEKAFVLTRALEVRGVRAGRWWDGFGQRGGPELVRERRALARQLSRVLRHIDETREDLEARRAAWIRSFHCTLASARWAARVAALIT